MNDPVAALLYLLGRHVTTTLRVRREDEEIVLSRRQAPPLRELHDALERGEQLAIDPWVDLEDGTRGVVCLWARTPCPEVTVDDLPIALRPQVWVQQGGSALAVWSLVEPSGQPGEVDPARAMREIAAALGITACDPRDYIPVPRDPQDLVIIEPGRNTDAAQLLRWARGVLADRRAREQQRREHEETAKRTAFRVQLVGVLAAIAAICRERDEVAARTAIPAAEDGDAHEEDLRQSQAGELEERAMASTAGESDPWAISLREDGSTTLDGRGAVLPTEAELVEQADIVPTALPRAQAWRASEGYHNDTSSDGARSRLAAVIADARKDGWDEGRLHTMLVEAMAELGTRDVWAALGVTMTSLRNGRLYGLRGDRWVSMKDLLATE